MATATARTDRWTQRDDEQLMVLRQAGATMREIAERIEPQRSFVAVSARLHELRQMQLVKPLNREQRKERDVRVRASRTSAAIQAAREAVAHCESTEAFGYVVGLLYGDAFLVQQTMSIVLKARNRSFIRSFSKALRSCFGQSVKELRRVEPIKRLGDRTYLNVEYFEAYLHKRHIGIAMAELLGDTTKRGWKLDVEAALKRGPSFCRGMLRGLFDSDGSFQSRGSTVSIRFGTTNQVAAKAVREVMSRLGFQTSIGKPTKVGEVRVAVLAVSAVRFAREIGSGVDYKAAVLRRFLKSKLQN